MAALGRLRVASISGRVPPSRALRFRLTGGHVVPRINPSTCAVAATVSGLGAIRQSLMLPLSDASRIQEATAKASC